MRGLQGPGSLFSHLGPKALLLGEGVGTLVRDGDVPGYLDLEITFETCTQLGVDLGNQREFSSIVINTGAKLETETQHKGWSVEQ